MKIFLSALETNWSDRYKSSFASIKMKWNLMSFYYIRGKVSVAEEIRSRSEEILIDSGAHSFQKGAKVNWLDYTREYAEFIKKFDSPKVIGYFEMDVDNIIGYEKVLQLRAILEAVSDKIIPVWHKNRGIGEFKSMCQRYAGKIIAITGFKNEDIRDEQYPMFLKYAKKYGCKVHCLGMTRRAILDKVPFDFVDSSSWKQGALYGRIGQSRRKVSRDMSRNRLGLVLALAYKDGVRMQEHYYGRWKTVCGD